MRARRFDNIAATMTNILVVDPDVRRRAGLRGVLERHGFHVVEGAGWDRLEALHAKDGAADIGAIVASAHPREGSGAALAPLLRTTPVILIAEDATVAAAVSAMRAGAADYVAWPASDTALIDAVRRASAGPGDAAEAGRDTSADWPIFGSCAVMLDLFERIRAAARTDAAVLVRGESGTGKELVARALHARGPRRHAPMISLNCAAIPGALIESELFGHGRADAPNASAAGLVAAATAGTLFLNEVGELPPAVQERFLDVPVAGAAMPPGSANRRDDVRVIAATQRNLELLVEHGQFRADLLRRLRGVTLSVPPLRDRGGDIAALARILARRAAARMGKPEPRFSTDAITAMEGYHWPGNVRELENAVERATILADQGDIPAELLAIEAAVRDTRGGAPAGDGEDAVSLEDYFVRFVTEHQDQYTETELATKLGISRKNLWERRKRHGIPRRRTRKRGPRLDPV